MSAVGAGGPVHHRDVRPVDGLGRTPMPRTRPTPAGRGPGTFHDVLTERLTKRSQPGVKFSAHAGERLRRAGVHVDAEFEARLQAAVDKAAAKGARSSLVLLDDMALVVSVQNRTVITAVESSRMKDNVFTNIDSAVIT